MIAARLMLIDLARMAGTAFAAAGRAVAFVVVWSYRLILRPLFPTTCRFEPSCSEYALQAVNRFGPLKGGWLALKRLGRCNPWGPFGADPVPPTPQTCTHHHHALRREPS